MKPATPRPERDADQVYTSTFVTCTNQYVEYGTG